MILSKSMGGDVHGELCNMGAAAFFRMAHTYIDSDSDSAFQSS